MTFIVSVAMRFISPNCVVLLSRLAVVILKNPRAWKVTLTR